MSGETASHSSEGKEVSLVKELTQQDVGAHVIFTDPTGREHDALVTAVHGTKCINCVYVLKDPAQYDSYGRKTNKQYTSISHGSIVQAHGNFWMWPGEDRGEQPVGVNPVTA